MKAIDYRIRVYQAEEELGLLSLHDKEPHTSVKKAQLTLQLSPESNRKTKCVSSECSLC